MNSSKGGSPVDPKWGFFSHKEINNKIVVECNSCKRTVSAKPYRMKEHHKKCNGATSNEHKQVSATDIQIMEEESSNKEQENSSS